MLRREFIKSLGFTVSGIFLAALPGEILDNAGAPLKCVCCGAQVARWNLYGAANKQGVFCPNCGIEVRKGAFMLQPSSARPILKSQKKRPVNKKWDCALVPFPNPDLVVQTGKPKMKLADIKF